MLLNSVLKPQWRTCNADWTNKPTVDSVDTDTRDTTSFFPEMIKDSCCLVAVAGVSIYQLFLIQS